MSPATGTRPDLFSAESVGPMSETALERLYSWVDGIPLSRQKKNISRDFADGVLAAEVIKHFLPNLIDLHSYVPSSSSKAKEHNWYHLNRKVLPRLGIELDAEVIRMLVSCQPMVVECFLGVLRQKIDQATARQFGYDYAVDDVKLKPLQNQMVGDSNIKMKKQWSDDYHTLPAVWTDDRPEADQQWRKRGLVPIGNPGNNYGSRDTEMRYPNSTGLLPSPKGVQNPSGAMKMADYQSSRSPARKPNKQVELTPKALLRQKEEELNVAKQTVEMLHSKVQKLEHLLQLKDIRIEDLSSRINGLEQQIKSKGSVKKMATNRYSK